jgi:hypothetical protein
VQWLPVDPFVEWVVHLGTLRGGLGEYPLKEHLPFETFVVDFAFVEG